MLIKERRNISTNNLNDTSHSKKKLGKVGMLIDMDRIRHYNLLDNPLPLDRFKFKQEHTSARRQLHAEAAIQTDETEHYNAANHPPESNTLKRYCLTDRNDFSETENSQVEADKSRHQRVASKYNRNNWQALALRNRQIKQCPIIAQQELRKPPPEFKRLFLQDEGDLHIVTGTVLAQRVSNRQQPQHSKFPQAQSKQPTESTTKRRRIFPDNGIVSRSYRSANDQCKQNVEVRQRVSPIQIKRTDKSRGAQEVMQLPAQVVRSIHSLYIAQELDGIDTISRHNAPDQSIGGFEVTTK